ncbi:MAG TPA: hypothetical protein VK470_10770, partial [Bacteroidota bacterium]|nr:hypothetical protein [Bacteroidota bacterium]
NFTPQSFGQNGFFHHGLLRFLSLYNVESKTSVQAIIRANLILQRVLNKKSLSATIKFRAASSRKFSRSE